MRRMLVVAAAILLVAPACGDLLDPAAAVVYGDKIAIEEVQRQLDAYVESRGFKQLAAQGDTGALKREFEQGRLTDLIMRAVLTPAAEERGIEVTDQDVQDRIDEFVAAEFDGNAEQLEEALTEQGLTQAQFHEIIHDQILNESLRADVAGDVKPTAEDVQAFYEENRAEYETTRAQHILVDDRALAEQLASRLQAASGGQVEALFERLAREHSTDPGSARRGGDLGYQPAGTFVAPFEEALAGLDVGEVSDPVRSDFGFHVIRVMDRRVTPLEEVRDDIEDQLAGPAQDEAWSAFLDDLFEEADVEVNPRYGVFDETTFEVVDPDADDIPAGEAPRPSEVPSPPQFPGAPPPPG
ncbi:MAG: peptidylprolyl isomerase [Actinomycetota bacterium]|nr:peptidylprolyl isomerase [Actinomycetota bacterium]